MTEIVGLSNQVTGGNIHWDVADTPVGRVGSNRDVSQLDTMYPRSDQAGEAVRQTSLVVGLGPMTETLWQCVCLHLDYTLKTKEMDEII